MGLITLAYFALSAWAIYEIAIWSADYLLGLSNADQSLRTPVYIVVSGAVLGVTTLIFWAGRLFSKLYLSEHHLKSECLEKAVMTQAFLSMETREDFSPEERAVVLASIFRSSADGMVKDDGPGDIGLPLLLSRIVSKS
nr:DUF6161 domain-containing protein [Novosphingobium pentaromativorans]